MEEIIKPVSKELLKAELTEDRRLRMTNKSNNQIYIITHQNAPNVMRNCLSCCGWRNGPVDGYRRIRHDGTPI